MTGQAPDVGWKEERPRAEEGDQALRMTVSEVITLSKNFILEEAGFEKVRVSSAIAIEAEANWKVVVELGQPPTEKKELVVDDRDGRIVSYKQA